MMALSLHMEDTLFRAMLAVLNLFRAMLAILNLYKFLVKKIVARMVATMHRIRSMPHWDMMLKVSRVAARGVHKGLWCSRRFFNVHESGVLYNIPPRLAFSRKYMT
jgi:hypothetical protein